MISFSNEQIFLVTGASSGIGEETALLLNALGARVIAIARHEERLKNMQRKAKFPENMSIETKDLVEDIETLPKYVSELKTIYGKFTGLAYCAGIFELTSVDTLDYAQMKALFDIDYFSPLFMAKGFADRRNNIGEGASMVFISSHATTLLENGLASYAGAKAALSASTRVFASELASRKIRVNCVSPSSIKTPLILSDAQEKEYPFGFGEVSDVAKFIVFLLSDASKWVTKQDYIVDCGHR